MQKQVNDVVTYVRNGVALNALVLASALVPVKKPGVPNEFQKSQGLHMPDTTVLEEHLTLVYVDPQFAKLMMGSTEMDRATARAIGVTPLADGGTNGWREVSSLGDVSTLNDEISNLGKESIALGTINDNLRAALEKARSGAGPIKSAIEIAARTSHEANRILCIVFGDLSQPTWADAPDWQKASARLGAQFVADDPNVTLAQQHESWSQQKIADGWIYGLTKDPEKKTHPCLVPYEQLPASQQCKDWMFGAVVRGVLGLPQLDLHAVSAKSDAIPEEDTHTDEIADAENDHGQGESTPAEVTPEAIAEQNEHDHSTGNVNSQGLAPAEAVAAESAPIETQQ